MKSPSQTQVDHADADFDTCKVRTAHDSPADLALANITPKTGLEMSVSYDNTQKNPLQDDELPEARKKPESGELGQEQGPNEKTQPGFCEAKQPDQVLPGNTKEKSSSQPSSQDLVADEAVIFEDPSGERWTFPYQKCKTWNEVEELIQEVYPDYRPSDPREDVSNESEKEKSLSTYFFRLDPTSKVLKKHWELLVRPGWTFAIELPDEDESEAEDASDDSECVDILYVTKYFRIDDSGNSVLDRETSTKDKPAVEKLSGQSQSKQKSVLEEEIEVHPITLTTAQGNTIFEVGRPVLHVNSKILLEALKATIEFESAPDDIKGAWGDPILCTDLGSGLFIYPFTDLYHNREKLLEYRSKVKEAHDVEYSETCAKHIDILIDYLYSHPSLPVKEWDLMWNLQIRKSSFNSLRFLLKPGSDVYVKEHGGLNAYVIESVGGGPSWQAPHTPPQPYAVLVWNLNHDGRFLTRSVREINIPIFDGERELDSLPLFPTRFYEEHDASSPLRQQLVERGKSFVEMVASPSYRGYTGPSKLQGVRQFHQARVIIDHSSQPWNEFAMDSPWVPVKSIPDLQLGARTRTPKCTCPACDVDDPLLRVVRRYKFDDYDDIDLQSTKQLTDHQYLLCWSHVHGFVLKDRAWDVLELSGLEEPKIRKDIFDLVVMKPERNKEMIKAICEIYGGSYIQNFRSDLIEGKGEGQILLLHGPPGTGKTLTAESVAEYCGKPLLSITAADLGHSPAELEEKLLQFFHDAQKWNAIVLLDEADVYLQQRAQNSEQNNNVSVFLRALDYFQGILFLTTNRVGTFDEAFMSRIHIQIGYDKLEDSSRKQIWDNHFKKLANSHKNGGPKIEYSFPAKEYIKTSQALKNLDWNGREIRNAFQTAVTLACYDAKKEEEQNPGTTVTPVLTDDHLDQVVSMSHNFKDYLKTFVTDTAYASRARNDRKTTTGSE